MRCAVLRAQGIEDLIRALKARGVEVFLISGGFRWVPAACGRCGQWAAQHSTSQRAAPAAARLPAPLRPPHTRPRRTRTRARREMALPIADQLKIPAKNVFAVRLAHCRARPACLPRGPGSHWQPLALHQQQQPRGPRRTRCLLLYKACLLPHLHPPRTPCRGRWTTRGCPCGSRSWT